METIINNYISKELVQDAALLPLSDDASLLDSVAEPASARGLP